MGTSGRLERFRESIRQHEASMMQLRTLLRRVELMVMTSEACEITYAVDFSEVFSFVYPALRKVGGWRVHAAAPSTEMFIRDQMALAFAFYGLTKSGLVLLPPYEVELRHALTLVRRRIVDVYGNFSTSSSVIAEMLGSLKEREVVQSILEAYEQSGALSSENTKTLLNILGETYEDLYEMLVLLYARLGESYVDLRELIEGASLIPLRDYVSKHWSRLSLDHDRIIEDSRRWLPTFESLRSDPERSQASYIDAVAVSYVNTLNEALESEGHVVLLITRGDTYNLLNKQTIERDVNGARVILPLAVNTDQLFTWLLYRGATPDSTRERLTDAKRLVSRFDSLRADLQAIDEYEPSGRRALALCDKAASLLGEIEQNLDTERSLRLIAAEEDYLRAYSARIQSIPNPSEDAAFVDRVVRLIISEEGIQESVKAELEALAKDTRDDLSRLETLLGLRDEVLAIERLSKLRVSESDRAALPHSFEIAGLYSAGIPYKIRFRHTETADVAERFSELGSGDPDVVQRAYERLLELVGQRAGKYETHLLIAYVQAMSDHLEVALRETEKALKLMRESESAEPHFMRGVLLRLLGRPNDALSSCEAALAIREDDPRFLKEMGYSIWQCLMLQLKSVYTLNDAITFTEQARRYCSDSELQVFILNNLAYFYCERNALGDLELARSCMEVLGTLRPREQWNGYFLDTHTMMVICTARRGGIPPEERLKLLSEAFTDAKRARELLRADEPFVGIVDEHIGSILSLLREAGINTGAATDG